MGEDQQSTEQTTVPRLEEEALTPPLEPTSQTERLGVSKKVIKAVSALRFFKNDPDKALNTLAQQDTSSEGMMGELRDTSHEASMVEQSASSGKDRITVTDSDGREITRDGNNESIQNVGLWTSVTKASLRMWDAVKEHPDTALVVSAAALGAISLASGSNITGELSTVLGGLSIGLGVAEKGLFGRSNGDIDTKRKLLGAIIGGATIFVGSELVSITMSSVAEAMNKYIGMNSHINENTIRILASFADDAVIATKATYQATSQTLKSFAKVK